MFRITEAEMAVVLEKGVEHHYTASAGGWGGHDERRETDQGILLRVTRHDRTPVGRHDLHLRPETYETTARAAQLIPAEGEDLERWQAARARGRQRETEAAVRRAEQERIRTAFARAGYDVRVFDDLSVQITAGDVDRLLGGLVRAAQEQP